MGEFDPIKFTSIRAAPLPRPGLCTDVPERFMQSAVVNSIYLPIGTDLHYSSGIAAMLKRAILLLTQIKWICARLCRAIGQGSMRNNFAD